ncbi:hypothetical protein [Streptomyces adustus]
MTDTPRTPPPPAAAPLPSPCALGPGRREAEHSHTLSTGPVRDHTCTAACEPSRADERTRRDRPAETLPADSRPSERPHTTGALPPAATLTGRLAMRGLPRRPAPAAPISGPLRYAAAVLALIGCAAVLHAAGYGIPASIAWPLALLAPLLPRHLPHRRGARTRNRDHTFSAAGDRARQDPQRRAAPHTCVPRSAAGSNRPRPRRAAETGRHLQANAAAGPQAKDTRSASAPLPVCGRLMPQLADQAAQTLKHTYTKDAPADTEQPRAHEHP